MNRFTFFSLLSVGCLGVALGGCPQQSENTTNTASPTTTSTASTVTGSPQSSPGTNSSPSPNNQAATTTEKSPTPSTGEASQSASSGQTGQQVTALRPPLTVEKLKNAEYFFLAKGPVKLVKGGYEDKDTKRSYTMSDVVAYGDINKDGIKDAVTTLKVTIPNQGDFSYLVALVNDAGVPKNVSTEFMGPGIQVKTLKVNADNSIEAVMDQYQAGDPECCPSLKITRTYKLKNQPSPPS